MKYTRFEQLPVWNSALQLAESLFLFFENHPRRSLASLRNQLERATLSISNNIAEGFERGTTRELITFLYIARGSSAEVRSMLVLMERLRPYQELKEEIAELRKLTESISRQIRGWATNLQNSKIRGQRYQNLNGRLNREDDNSTETEVKD